MAFERIELNICPAGDMPVFHCSQYDTGRPIIIDLKNGDDAFTPSAGTTFELHCRKVDDNIVTLDTYEVDGNTLTFTSTEQLCACPGDNLCEVAIYLDELCMGTLNFMLHVEPDPLAGGLESETQIYNLTEQVEEITEQVIGDNYYDKTEVDDLLDAKADAATTYTKTEVDTALNLKADKSDTYTKTETNNLLAVKADASDTYSKAQVDSKLSLKADKATTYTKTETDTLLGYKANASQVYTMSQTDLLLADKADKSTTYTKTQVDNALALKADAATTYTKIEVDNALALKANASDVYTKSEVYNKTETYTQAQVDALIADIFPTKTATGAIASFITALAMKLVSCTVAEGATTVTRCGVNFLNIENSEQGGIDASGTEISSSQTWRANVLTRIHPGVQYTLSIDSSKNYSVRLYFYDENGTFISPRYENTTKLTATAPSNAKYFKWTIYTGDETTMEIIQASQPQLETGATRTTYHTYNSQTVSVADATTLVTLPGVNNVFADSGDVTVQFKDTTL